MLRPPQLGQAVFHQLEKLLEVRLCCVCVCAAACERMRSLLWPHTMGAAEAILLQLVLRHMRPFVGQEAGARDFRSARTIKIERPTAQLHAESDGQGAHTAVL